MSSHATYLTAEHFQFQQIVDGVYAAIAIPGHGAASNAGIIDIGGQTLVFDTGLTPQAGAALYAAATELTGSPVTTVINSHYHRDHMGGNQAFPEAVNFIATSRTRCLITEQSAQKLEWLRQHGQSQLTELEAALDKAQRRAEQEDLQNAIGQQQHLLAALPTLVVRAPTMTFDQRLVLYGRNRVAELITYGGGHTQSDAILYLPAEGIIFMGDLLTVKHHPALSDGDPGELPRILDLITRLEPQQLIPGHGPVGRVEDLQLMQQYLGIATEIALTELTFQTESDEAVEKRIASLKAPSPFGSWQRSSIYASNLRFLYQRAMTAYAE
ncbi:MAG: MBL fold metallo-hydrolase [Caldilineaceae bacterium]